MNDETRPFREATCQQYVRLVDEPIDVWRPVAATWLSGTVYRIDEAEIDPDLEQWEFAPGTVVRVERQRKSGETILVAVAIDDGSRG